MDERLAVVTNSLPELVEQLEQYLSGKNHLFLYTNNVKNKQSASELLDHTLDDEENKDFIASLISERKIAELARLWTSGIDINWALLPQEHQPKRISLPTYPFSRKRYWLPNRETETQGKPLGSSGDSRAQAQNEDLSDMSIQQAILILLKEEKISEEQAFQLLGF